MIDKYHLPQGTVAHEDNDGLVIIEPSATRAPKASADNDGNGFVPLAQRAEEDRPREKLMAKGAEALTNAELLAILIGNGTRKKTAVELMQDVLSDCNGQLRHLNHLTLNDLLQYNGIGEAKALTIIAAAELGRRRAEEHFDQDEQFDSAEKVYNFMRPKVQDLTHEECWVLLLNNSARMIHCAHLSQGGLSETSVDVRMLLKQALLHDATCFILVHNHPSGRIKPSKADEKLTECVHKAADTMNIQMLDHVIVSDGAYYSFNEKDKL